MKGIRFYEEFKNSAKTETAGTCIALFVCNGTFISGPEICYEGLSGLFDQPDSPVCSGGVGLSYLRSRCKRIPEWRARLIHPRLFDRLDEPEECLHSISPGSSDKPSTQNT